MKVTLNHTQRRLLNILFERSTFVQSMRVLEQRKQGQYELTYDQLMIWTLLLEQGHDAFSDGRSVTAIKRLEATFDDLLKKGGYDEHSSKRFVGSYSQYFRKYVDCGSQG